MRPYLVIATAALGLLTAPALAEERTPDTGITGSAGTETQSASADSGPERPDLFRPSARPARVMSVPAGRIMSSRELTRAGLDADDMVEHLSRF